MFSIVIPLYNKEQSVKNTIQSVLNQTFSDFELIIVNDGSTDKSLVVVQQFKDHRIRIIDQANAGVSAARNRGIKEAKNEWICFLDADDLWLEEHLVTLKQMIEVYPQQKVFCTSYILSDKIFPNVQDNSIIVIYDYFKEAIKFHFFWTSVTCIHKTVFEKIGNFNTLLNRGEDLELWTRIGRKYSFVRSKKITALYIVDSENKLSIGKSAYSKSILSIINLKDVLGTERRYLKKLLFQRVKEDIKILDIKELIVLLTKHKLELLK